MKKNHWLICLGSVAVAAGIGLFVPRANWGTAALILICPAIHLFMMKGMDHGGHSEYHKDEKK